MPKSDVGAIAAAIQEALAAWKTFIATREAAYNRKKDKKQVKAIDAAEQLALKIKSLDLNNKEVDKLIIRFFKYN